MVIIPDRSSSLPFSCWCCISFCLTTMVLYPSRCGPTAHRLGSAFLPCLSLHSGLAMSLLAIFPPLHPTCCTYQLPSHPSHDLHSCRRVHTHITQLSAVSLAFFQLIGAHCLHRHKGLGNSPNPCPRTENVQTSSFLLRPLMFFDFRDVHACLQPFHFLFWAFLLACTVFSSKTCLIFGYFFSPYIPFFSSISRLPCPISTGILQPCALGDIDNFRKNPIAIWMKITYLSKNVHKKKFRTSCAKRPNLA